MKRLAFVGGVLVVALFAAVAARASIDEPDPVVIVHWANSHPMREGLLPEMAEEFNKEDHKTADGRPIKVVMIACDSSDQAADLVERVGGPSSEADCHSDSGDSAPDPTIITPQADDWLLDVNRGAGGRDVIDLDSTDSIAETYMGIVTYRAMAECLGWPNRELGYADIIPVLEEGWDAYPGCTPELDWRDPPRVAFTNPNTSTSGRNVLVSLFAMYADNTSPEDLTVEDIEDPGVLGDVKSFQALLDHYMAATSLVNTRIAGGPEYGSFFLMPEDNLANLLLGNETQIGTDGKKQSAEAPEDELVMIYPKEGAVLNSNPAAFVDAPWVTHEQSEGARSWIDYVRDDQQQQRFMDMGFRPATGLDVDDEKFTAWGLEPSAPKSIIDPGALKADVLQAILDSWGEVKKPAIVTFVVDVSGSMDGEPIEQVKDGLIEVLKSMKGPDSAGQNSQVGLVMFYGEGDDGDVPVVDVKVEPGPLEDVQRQLVDAIDLMRAHGGTPLYDAVRKAIEVTSEAEGDDGATRAVVVLSDGEDNLGTTCLDNIVTMQSRNESDVRFCGKLDPDTNELTEPARDDTGNEVATEDITGTGPKLADDVQVFFLAFGEADINIGRILARATQGEYVQPEKDLAAVIEELSGYF